MTIPSWLEQNPGLLAVLETWFTDKTLKGEVALFFRYTELTRIEPKPVLDGAALKTARRADVDAASLPCPDCGKATAERDYGAKRYCWHCDRTYPVSKIVIGLRQTPPVT